MKSKSPRWISAALLTSVAALVACNSNDLLYYKPVDTPKFVEQQRAIREMVGNDLVDILWVIDNSGSMGNYQQEVIRNAETFMQEFQKKGTVRWKMGLISTDEMNSPYLGFTSPFEWNSPDPAQTFRRAVASLGLFGSGTEKTFVPITKHLSQNPNFLRPNANTVLIFVTDAEEQSGFQMNATQFLQRLTQLRGGRTNELLAYGVFAANDFGCQSDEGPWNYAGSPYEAVISQLNGKAYPICQNFGVSLSDLARDVVRRMNFPVLYLGARPVPSTIVVKYKGVEIPGGSAEVGGYWYYDYDRVALVFHDMSFAPGDQESVDITFEEAK